MANEIKELHFCVCGGVGLGEGQTFVFKGNVKKIRTQNIKWYCNGNLYRYKRYKKNPENNKYIFLEQMRRVQAHYSITPHNDAP